jgi:hypothetical protein
LTNGVATINKVFVPFELSVSNCHWLIRTRPSNSTTDYHETAGDGTSVWTVRLLKSDIEKRKQGGAADSLNVADGEVFPLGAPPYDSSYASPLWLAYASGCYFSSLKDAKVMPVYSISRDPEVLVAGVRVGAEWTLHEGMLKLPERVLYSNDGTRVTWDPRQRRTSVDRKESPWDRPFTNAIFQVITFTNVAGLDFPARCLLTRYSPNYSSRTALDIIVAEETEAVLTNIIVGPVNSRLVPEIPGLTFIGDFRFLPSPERLHGISYLIHDKWFSKAEVMETEQFKKRLATTEKRDRAYSSQRPDRKRSTFLMLAFVLFVVMVPLLAFLFLLKMKQQK